MLKIKQLLFGYNKPLVDKPFDFYVKNPAIISVIGLNGSGKTTLLKTLAGLIAPLDGSIQIFHYNINDLKIKEKSKLISFLLAYLPQTNLTVEQVLTINPYNRLIDHKFAVKVTKIEGLLHKKFNKLSEGQKQKVMIAKVIGNNTPLLLLDEPDNHLDLSFTSKFFEILKLLSKKKLIIYTTHNIHYALTFSDYLWIITKNKLISVYTEKVSLSLIKQALNLDFQSLQAIKCNLISLNKRQKLD